MVVDIQKPRISMITPVWNGMPFLQECVDSVLSQDFSDWEMIISDDGSADGSRDYLDTLSDPRIRIFKQEKNSGIFGNLNFLFGKASAPISQILCQDDYLTNPGALTYIMHRWSELPAEVGFMRINWGSNLSCSLRRYAMDAVPGIVKPTESDLMFFLFGNIPGNLSNVSLRTELPERAGWFDQSLPYAGDFEFWSRAGREIGFAVDRYDGVFIRHHTGRASIQLNRHGELINQSYGIVDGLYTRVRQRLPDANLRLFATVNHDCRDRWNAIRRLVQGRGTGYLRLLNEHTDAKSAFLPNSLRWLLFFVTGGGRWGRALLARHILSQDSR